MHKRRLKFIWFAILILSIFLFGCDCTKSGLTTSSKPQNNGEFSVHYLDVGQGDAIFLYFPDGKTMLIDTGNGEKQNDDYLAQFFKDFGVSKIDYLILTHPDSDHIGGALNVVENFEIGKAFIPHILQPENFASFKNVKNLLEQKHVPMEISSMYKNIKGEEYSVVFLSPYPLDFPNVESSYEKLNGTYLTDGDINNASPIIYVEYKNVRFLFTGDAGSSQEKIVLDIEKALKPIFSSLGINLTLNSIDFLKLSHHGSADSNTQEFLNLLKPKNAIISVGGGNVYGHPSTVVLERLITANPEHNLYRTDVLGTISVFVSDSGQVNVLTESD